MMPNYWMENAMKPGRHILVDLGYTADAEANFLALSPHIGKANFQRVGNDRLVARIPRKQLQTVLAALPQIKEGAAGYCWCTHGFVPDHQSQGEGGE